MEPFSSNTLTILVLTGVILSGVAFLTICILIIYLLCKKSDRSAIVSPMDTEPSISYNSRSPSVLSSASSTSIKSAVIPSTKTEEQPRQSQIQKYRSDSISIIDEDPSYNQKKYQHTVRRYGDSETTTRNESQVDIQPHQQRRQQSIKTRTNVQFNNRQTPYPPEVLARERIMKNHFRLSVDEEHN